MSKSLSDIVLHIVFSTKDRSPWIQPELETELYAYISAISKNLNCPVIQINGYVDHIHMLVHLGRTISVSQLIAEIKSNSSRWIKTKGYKYNHFCWQRGYGVFSVSRTYIEGVIKYIAMQKERHKKVTFKDELLAMLSKAKISFKEKYLWD